MKIEWPKGSGVVAAYSPFEQREIARHIADCQRAGVPPEQIEREVGFLHALKARFEATMLPVAA